MWFIVGLGLAARAGHFEKDHDPSTVEGIGHGVQREVRRH
jgi:hypothetical protein